MHLPASISSPRLPVFDMDAAFIENALYEHDYVEHPAFSEISLRGMSGNCLHLLAPILRELSQVDSTRWLTLIAPPKSLTRHWLRSTRMDREKILLLEPRAGQSAEQLACQALRLGHSHTVLSWLTLTTTTRQQLIAAAEAGRAQSLNICLA